MRHKTPTLVDTPTLKAVFALGGWKATAPIRLSPRSRVTHISSPGYRRSIECDRSGSYFGLRREVSMPSRWLIVAILGVVTAASGPGTHAQAPGPHATSARIAFAQPTYVSGHVLLGEYVIVHDPDRMEADEPCTTIYRPTRAGAQAVVSFHCVPTPRKAVDHVVVKVAPSDRVPWFKRLVEYQLAGETEGHGVPF